LAAEVILKEGVEHVLHEENEAVIINSFSSLIFKSSGWGYSNITIVGPDADNPLRFASSFSLMQGAAGFNTKQRPEDI